MYKILAISTISVSAPYFSSTCRRQDKLEEISAAPDVKVIS